MVSALYHLTCFERLLSFFPVSLCKQSLCLLSIRPWPTCLFFAEFPPTPGESSIVCSRPLSVISFVTVLTRHFLGLAAVSVGSCPAAVTATFGQCPSLFASPAHFGNPSIAGNHWWMKSLSHFNLFLLLNPPPPSPLYLYHPPTRPAPLQNNESLFLKTDPGFMTAVVAIWCIAKG